MCRQEAGKGGVGGDLFLPFQFLVKRWIDVGLALWDFLRVLGLFQELLVIRQKLVEISV